MISIIREEAGNSLGTIIEVGMVGNFDNHGCKEGGTARLQAILLVPDGGNAHSQ